MNSQLKDKNIILGITGSIAAYKAAEIIRLLKEREARVYPVMTERATHFVHPTTFKVLAGQQVTFDLFTEEREMKHISLSALADLMVIAPATGNIIGKIAAGIADDILTTTVMATSAPVVIAPAMNERMYFNPLVQQNIRKLKALGYRFIGPQSGKLACGDVGRGRMSEPETIVNFLEEVILSLKDLKGRSFIITAGPTREPWDRVRFISNYSSGKMGFALAEEARERGVRVILISGPTLLEPPGGVEFYPVETCREMKERVEEFFQQVDGLIMASAPADFSPLHPEEGKISKEGKERIILEMVKNPDILEKMGKIKGKKILVGFCAETEDLVERAKKKLKRKNLDLVVANDLTQAGAGFGVDTNQVIILNREGKIKVLPLMSKREVAREIWKEIKKLFFTEGKM
jgi:phosphopantothenoylcysteine decarboxylase/phosphopantothenate--cysteine ligase